MTSLVTKTATASPDAARDHFSRLLALETDCSDVKDAFDRGVVDFVLLDVRGPNAYAAGHIAGALNIPHREISNERMAVFPRDTLFVVYCAGPHCNGADQAALRLSELGCRVKKMIGGIAGWRDEGFSLK
jgi:rhodanese-related sulfurtransferase